ASKALASEVPVWRKASDWGTPLTVSGLVQKSDYFFSIAARSQDFVTSAWSAEQKVTTLNILTVLGLAPRGLKVQLGGPVYDPATTFLIRCGGAKTGYVQADGKIGAAEVWRTLAQWNNASGIYIHSLAPNSNYTFDIRAQFGGNLSEWSDPKPALTNIEGDCDGSNKVNILDLIFVRAKLNQSVLSGDNYKADADDSGLINILDLIRVRAYLNTHR
ncbi:MAG TPA: dockerin type I domain-containing protein, partial [Planctomycetota bacterium]|nr:dockerin type I domain-containing protein [Planctomycetota bacterium]